jgi:hypothetical protein
MTSIRKHKLPSFAKRREKNKEDCDIRDKNVSDKKKWNLARNVN